MSLLSGGEGIRSEDFFVFVPCSFPVWDAVLFSYVRKAVNLPRMDRLLASTCPVSHRSALSPHRKIRRCREPTPEWLRTSKLLELHRNHTHATEWSCTERSSRCSETFLHDYNWVKTGRQLERTCITSTFMFATVYFLENFYRSFRNLSEYRRTQ